MASGTQLRDCSCGVARNRRSRHEKASRSQENGYDAELIGSKARELWMDRRERFARRAFAPQKERGSTGQPGMAQKEPRQLCARVTRHTQHRDL